jgi:PAS domain S-box-containing protein
MKKSRVGLDISGKPEDSPEKRREAAFPESEKLFSLVFRSSPVAIGISRLSDGRFIDVNNTFLEIYGFAREEVIGHTSTELGLWVEPEQRAHVIALLRAQGHAHDLEIRCRRKSGEIGDLLVSAERIDLDGELCFLGTFFDITRRKSIEEAFRENERRYRAVVEDQTEVISRINADGELTFVNDVYCRFFGKSKEELVGRKWRPDAVDEDIPMIEERLATLSPANPVVVVENRVHCESGDVRWMQFVNRGFFDKDGKLLESQAIGRDITDRKKTEQELANRQNTINTMAMELSVAEERERCRIAEQLHDQIAPKLFLTKMKVHSLIDRLPPGDYGPAMDAVDALIDLGVEDIRSLTFQLRPPILADVGLEAALRWLGEEFNENYGLQVQIEDDKKVKPLKYELRSAIFQIVRELLLNVAKHAGTKNAAISIKREKETIIVTVEDNGVGFDVENSSLIKPRSGGFGIFNTRMKIEYLGGELSIVSSPGRGTRISIRAPIDTTKTRTEK